MSRLSELIAELCPDGVEYKTLSELFDIRNGYTPSKKNPSFWEGGTHPWFVMEDIRRDGTVLAESAAHITDEALKKNGLFPANSIIVATSATIGVHALITVDFLCNQRFACMTIKKKYADTLNIRYVHQAFFALDRWCLEHVDQGNFATVNSAALKAYRIPIPPIEVQREIVRVLDSFQELDDALTAEIEAREKQFEKYRDELLEERLQKMCPDGVEYKALGDIEDEGLIKLGRGKVISKKAIAATPGDYPIYSSAATNEGLFGKYGKWMFDDTRITWSVDGGGKFFYRQGGRRYSVTNVCGWMQVASEEIDAKYLYYTLSNEWSKKVFDYVHKAHPSVIREEYVLPLPPIEVQREIVRILDSFQEHIEALRCECDARRKQFEHYRDRLLAFPEKVA